MSMQQSYTNHALKSTQDFLVTSSLIKYSIEPEAQDTKGKHINNAATAVTISAS